MRLFMLLLLVSSSLAISQFHSGWHYPGDSFDIDGVLYTIDPGSSAYSIYLVTENESYILSIGECADSLDGFTRYCYNESDYVSCERGKYDCGDCGEDTCNDDWCCPYDVSHIQFDGGRAEWGGLLKFYEIAPELSLERKFNDTSLKPGEEATVTITITHEGTQYISNVHYREFIPPGFRVTSPNGLTVLGNILEARPKPNPGSTLKYSYRVTPTGFNDGNFTSNLTYMFSGTNFSVVPSKVTVTSPAPFKKEFSLTKKIPFGGSTELVYALTNNEDESMDVTVEFYTDLVDNVPTSMQSFPEYIVWHDTIYPGKKETLRLPLKGSIAGTHKVFVNTTMELDYESFYDNHSADLVVENPLFVPDLRITPNYVVEGKPMTIHLYLNNTGKVQFDEIRGRINGTGMQSRTFAVPFLRREDRSFVTRFNVTAPAQGTHTYVLYGSYLAGGNSYSFRQEKRVEVEEAVQVYDVTHTLNVSEVSPGDRVDVTVHVKSLQENFRNIRMLELFPDGITAATGVTQTEMSLSRDEEREAYRYQFVVPETTAPELLVTTEIYDTTVSERHEFPYTITVLQPEPEEELIEEVEPEPEVVVEEEEEQGFFSRMWTGIKNWWNGLWD